MAEEFKVTDQDTIRLSRMVDDLARRLRNQQQVLRQRGMDVPPGSIKNLESAHAELESTGTRIVEQNNELERLRALVETTALINSSLDLDETLGTVMDTVLSLIKAERGYIMLRNPERNAFEVRVARGISVQDADSGENMLFSRTIVERVAETADPIVTTNAQADPRFSHQKSIVGMSAHSILCVPLIIKKQVEGVIYADSSFQAGLFGKKELQLLLAVASQAAMAIENARLFEQARTTLEQISEFKALLDNILASIASGVITTDAQDLINTYNAGAEAILGLPSEHIYNRTLQEAIPHIYQEIGHALPQARHQDESITIDSELELHPGDLRHLNFKLSPLKNGEHDTQGIALVVDDQTELKRRDAMLDAVRRYLPPAMVDNIQDITNIALGGERRHITILFVEVLPFADLQQRLEASELMELLNIYLTVGTEAIHRRKGLIDKYMGSEIMGLFNTQLNPSEAHAWDALQAALEMMLDFEELYEKSAQPVSMPYYRIGVHTGIATLGNVGGMQRREFTAIGDTVNLAKRLEENAQVGELIISEETYRACAANLDNMFGVDVVARGSLQVKGRLQTTPIYQVRYSH